MAFKLKGLYGQPVTDQSGNVAIDFGPTVPSDGAKGYAKGGLFIQTDGSNEATLWYVNVGSTTSANFDAIDLNISENALLSGLTADAAEINRTSDASARIVTTTATVLALTVTEHAERVVLINTNSTVANTFTLPAATGSGAKFTLINNIAQTQGTVVWAANGTDVLKGICKAFDSTAAADAMCFITTATSDKVSLNRTTTGGLGYDMIEAWDSSANTWSVRVEINGSGSMGTPFSET